MDISKAITILTIHNDHNPDYSDAEREEAHQLGIEALRRLRWLRDELESISTAQLPGETEEKKEGTTMTLEKALEIILLDLHKNEKITPSDATDSLHIAVEAIELVMDMRIHPYITADKILLHETK